jgi:hypothetical protein
MALNVARRPGSVPWIQVLGGLGVGALSVALWFGWMGWDSEYQIDPVTSVARGPYEAWQVLGCVVSLLVVLVGALLAGVRALVASATMTVAFTAAWTATAASQDVTGLYGVGAVLLFVGLAASTAVVSLTTVGLRRLAASRRRA